MRIGKKILVLVLNCLQGRFKEGIIVMLMLEKALIQVDF
jgi:hypothetical protein